MTKYTTDIIESLVSLVFILIIAPIVLTVVIMFVGKFFIYFVITASIAAIFYASGGW